MTPNTLETDKALLYRLANAPILITLGVDITTSATAIPFVYAFQLPHRIQIIGGRWVYQGSAALVGAVALAGLKNGVAIPGCAVSIPIGTASNTTAAFDVTTFLPTELGTGDILTFTVTGNAGNPAGSVVGLTLTARPI